MSKLRRILLHPATSVVLFFLATVLLLAGGVGGAQAALKYFSERYVSRLGMNNIGVSLLESNTAGGIKAAADEGKALDLRVSWRDYKPDSDFEWDAVNGDPVAARGVLLSNLLGEDKSIKVGKAYTEELAVINSGLDNEDYEAIDQYVRVSIYKYWTDKDGNKTQALDPSLIELGLVNLDSDWILDEGASTPERTVLYYKRLLKVGETTPIFADKLTINGGLSAMVTETRTVDGDYTVITRTYDYDGYGFNLEVAVDAVQDHNPEAAIRSAWGRPVTVKNETLTLDNN